MRHFDFKVTHKSKKINLLFCRSLLLRLNGLRSLKTQDHFHGVVFVNLLFFHSFFFKEPFYIVALNRQGKVIGMKCVHPNHIIFVHPRVSWVVETKLPCVSDTGTQIKTLPVKFVFAILFFCFSVFSFAHASVVQRIFLTPEQNQEIALKEIPEHVEVENSKVVLVEQVGNSPKLRITGKKKGVSQITVKFFDHKEKILKVKVSEHETSPKNVQSSENSLLRIAKDLSEYTQLDTTVENDTIFIFGVLKNQAHMRSVFGRLLNVSINLSSQLYWPEDLDPYIVDYLKQIIEGMQEPLVKVTMENRILVIRGIYSSEKVRDQIQKTLNKLVPKIIDKTNEKSNQYQLVQIEASFLEKEKKQGKQVGFEFGNDKALLQGNLSKEGWRIGPVETMLKALNEDFQFKEIAKPVLIARAGEKANFLSGGEVPVLFQTEKTSQVSYKSYGISLNVTPYILARDEFLLNVWIEISSLSPEQNWGANAGFKTRRVETSVSLKEGQIAVLSGLVRHADVARSRSIPFLDSIPILRLFLSSSLKEKESSEVWVTLSAQGNEKSFLATDKQKESFADEAD